jgi:putative transposase
MPSVVSALLAYLRRVGHVNVMEHPTAKCTAQPLVEVCPWDETPRYLLRHRDTIYDAPFQQRAGNMAIEEVKIAPCSPWQNPYAERLIGSICRDDLNAMIGLNEHHLRCVLRSYMGYGHTWQVHRSLDMDAPSPRPAQLPAVGPARSCQKSMVCIIMTSE